LGISNVVVTWPAPVGSISCMWHSLPPAILSPATWQNCSCHYARFLLPGALLTINDLDVDGLCRGTCVILRRAVPLKPFAVSGRGATYVLCCMSVPTTFCSHSGLHCCAWRSPPLLRMVTYVVAALPSYAVPVCRPLLFCFHAVSVRQLAGWANAYRSVAALRKLAWRMPANARHRTGRRRYAALFDIQRDVRRAGKRAPLYAALDFGVASRPGAFTRTCLPNPQTALDASRAHLAWPRCSQPRSLHAGVYHMGLCLGGQKAVAVFCLAAVGRSPSFSVALFGWCIVVLLVDLFYYGFGAWVGDLLFFCRKLRCGCGFYLC